MNELKLCENLARLRAERSMTQEELGAKLGVSDKTVSKWERGESAPDVGMLAALAEVFGTSTDCILGINTAQENKNTFDRIRGEFDGLSRGEAVRKTAEIAYDVIAASARILISENAGDVSPIPATYEMRRSAISTGEIFNFLAYSDDANVSVTLTRNKNNYAWMKDDAVGAKIAHFFSVLADPEAIKIMRFIHSADCPENFTAKYIAEKTGTAAEKSAYILSEYAAATQAHGVNAHLADGDVTVYSQSLAMGGLVLAVITLVYEMLCGVNGYNYNMSSDKERLIGGDEL